VIQAEVFNVGDRVRLRDIESRRGRTIYLVEATTSMFGRSLGPWWATHDDLQPAEDR
jgi:hypothetical protein